MSTDSQAIWRAFAEALLPPERPIKLRSGSDYKIAAPWIFGRSGPSMPVRMMSNVQVFQSWRNPNNMKLAEELVSSNASLTLRGLVNEMLVLMEKEKVVYPYTWWVYPFSPVTRTVYEDSDGISFVKLAHKWQMAFPVQAVGVLAGAQGCLDYENVPVNAYFVSWENEAQARKHIP